jgi:hypothetical protein
METQSEQIKRLEYYQSLLMEMLDIYKFPFYRLVMEEQLSEDETTEILTLCEELNQRFEEMREEGFVHYTPLLTHYVGMLNPKLNPLTVAQSLYDQKLYDAMMGHLIKMMKRNE